MEHANETEQSLRLTDLWIAVREESVLIRIFEGIAVTADPQRTVQEEERE